MEEREGRREGGGGQLGMYTFTIKCFGHPPSSIHPRQSDYILVRGDDCCRLEKRLEDTVWRLQNGW